MEKTVLMRYRKILFMMGMGIAVFILYLPVLSGQFLLDDFTSIVKNQAIRSLDVKSIFSFSPFRFIGYFSLALNFYFSKLDPYSYHIVNNCIHILFVALYFLFLQALWQTPSGKATGFSDKEKEGLAMAAALLIAVHPMSSFAVSYVVQRSASLAGLFYISCLFFYIRVRLGVSRSEKIKYLIPCIFFLFCAIFTKQNAFTIFPMIILVEMFCFDLTKKKIIIFFSGLGGFVGVFILLAILNAIDLNELQRLTHETKAIGRLEYFFNQFPVICFYLAQILIPNRLAIDYHSSVYSNYHPTVVMSGMILAAILAVSIFLGMKKNYRLAGFGILFYFTATSVESSFIPIRDLVFIHRTYLPNSGIFFAIIFLIYTLLKYLRTPLYLTGAILCLSIVFCAGLTWKTNIMFQDPLKVWQRVVDISPKHARGYANIGMTLVALGRYDEAEKNLIKAVGFDTTGISSLNNLGVIYSKTKQYDKAIELYKKIIGFNHNYVPAYVNLANTYADMGNVGLAIETYREGYKYNQHNFETLLNLGKHLAFSDPENTEQLREALELLTQAEKINDKHPVIYYAKAIAFLNLKDYNQAKINFRRTLTLNPDFKEARQALEKIE